MLQQYLPFTVLKPTDVFIFCKTTNNVATVLTVYGIETCHTVLFLSTSFFRVATVLTVYGIETCYYCHDHCCKLFLLQQYLPFTVLKPKKDLVLPLEQMNVCCNSTYRLRY